MTSPSEHAIRTVRRWSEEDRKNSDDETYEKIVANLKPGKNYLSSEQYQGVCQWLGIKMAQSGTTRYYGGIELVRADWLTENTLFTISDIARITGVPRMTVSDCAVRLKLCRQYRGKKVLYDINELRKALESGKT